jgi:[ribosomal protein S5]-alanine N-acetyltransferase
MKPLTTGRLTLIPLTLAQLKSGLDSIKDLSLDLEIPLVESLFDGKVHRAVTMKVDKMTKADQKLHLWYTYWLIVVDEENIGIGMVGYKGIPNEKGAVEIGYGIDPFFQRRGYMSEAVEAMVKWAFLHPECRLITATSVLVDNFASQKVLLRNRFVEIGQDEKGINFRLERSKAVESISIVESTP